MQLGPIHQAQAPGLWTVQLVHAGRFVQPVGQVGVPQTQHSLAMALAEAHSVDNLQSSREDRNQIVHN